MNANNKSLILAISLFFALSASISAAPGELDLSFGSGGIVITRDSSLGSFDYALGMAIQSDGKIIVVGEGSRGTFNWDFAVVRYDPDGSLDTSFGGTGIVITQLTSDYDGAQSVAIQADGKIVVAGVRDNPFSISSSFAVVRHNPDGSLDTSFGDTGIVITQLSSHYDRANAVAIQPDGKIVVAGSSGNGSNHHFAIVRYNPNGTLDTTFNGTGKVISPVGGPATSVAIQTDGKIIAAGGGYNGFFGFAVIRYNPNGTLDTTFNGTGEVITPVGNSDSGASELAIQSDGKIVVAGYSQNVPGNFITADFAVVRYNPNGSLDTSFGGTGKTIIPISNSYDSASSVAVQADGKIVAAGFSSSDGIGSFATVRFNLNGSLDTTFNGTGIVTTAFGGNAFTSGVAIQADGKIVVAGATEAAPDFYDFVVVRYQGDGATPIPTPTPTPTPAPIPSPTLHANGKIAFTSDRDGNPEIYVMNSDGTNQVRLTNNSVADDYPTWSPDGTKIAFVSQTASAGFAIFMMNPDGTNKVEITPNAGGPISWAPDGNRIAFQDNNDIAVVDIDGSNRHNLINGLEPSWSPDGSKILFTRIHSGTFILHTIRPDGTDLRTVPDVFRDGSADFSPNWSPLGDKIVFLFDDGSFYTVILTANADGTNRQLLDGCPTSYCPDADDRGAPHWSPDGTKVVFHISNRFHTRRDIYARNTDGNGFVQLTDGPGRNINPSWQPLAPATTPNPIDSADFFVRQHYLDFLAREPEQSGMDAWLAVLHNCTAGDQACLHEARLTTSAAFFGSPEFRLKGYFAFRFYRAAFNRLPTYDEIAADMLGLTGPTPTDVYQRRAAFAEAFVQRQEFASNFSALSNAEYVTTLLDRYALTAVTAPDPAQPDGDAKVTLTNAELVSHLNAGTLTRAQVLRAVADSDQVLVNEFNRAFVAMQYYGYLRRTPEPGGYQAWLDYLNAHPTDHREMVRGFVDSIEYRARFLRP